ncbi:MAG: hypothetical protein JNM06_09495, partial [Blastocatellia bacterium]|nr:hypothetical protein [Blastocatellia bacterium]
LAKFYEDDKNYFILLIVQYKIVQTSITVEQVHFLPIESLDWNCLTIGALGWGQIQIKNANTININATYSRKKWMKELCETLLKFYPKEVEKIKKRIDFFKVIKNKWEQKVDE